MSHVSQSLLHLIEALRERGRCPSRVERDLVVDAVVRSWGERREQLVEATARDGVAVGDLVLISTLIREHYLTCTVNECAEQLLRNCNEAHGLITQ